MRFALAISMCDPSHYVPLALAAERSGWDAVSVPDGGPWTEQISAPYGGRGGGQRWWQPDTPFLDPWVLIGALASATQRIRLYPSVMKLPIRSPIHIAMAVASAAALSGERVALGAGMGWNRDEYLALGSAWETRAARTDEALEVIRKLLAGGPVEHHGPHYDFEPLRISPVPREPVRIYVGGGTRAAMRRAARYADGWCSRAPESEAVIAQLPEMRAELAAAGRDTTPFEILAMCPDADSPDAFRRLEAAGVTEAQVWPWLRYGAELSDLPAKLDAVARFADHVISRI